MEIQNNKLLVIRLSSVKIINRVLYLNNDPAMNYMLPADNGWRVNELADEILRACAQYGVITKFESARFLASRLVKQILKEQRQTKGGLFDLGWN